jgi:electron transport complex protein RnfG
VGNFLRLVGTLAAIALVASFGLSAVYNATHEIAEEYKRQEEEQARIEVLACDPSAHFVETLTDSVVSGKRFAYHTAYASEESDEVLGYSFKAYGKGYSSTIETIVGVDATGKISATETIFQQETPGLGAKVVEVASKNTLWDVLLGRAEDETGTEPWFEVQFDGRDHAALIVVKSESADGILAITGATISSDAVTSSISGGLVMLLSIVDIEGAPGESSGAPADPAPEGTGAGEDSR